MQVNYAKLVKEALEAAKPAGAARAHPALEGRLAGDGGSQVFTPRCVSVTQFMETPRHIWGQM